jgi:hypothetical protein
MQSVVLKTLTKAIVSILKPLVRILLRHNVSFRTFSDIAKSVYVEIATKEFGLAGRKQSISRVSILTGLSRKEVKRVKEMPRPTDTDLAERYNRAVRVIAAWRREGDFTDSEGNPRVLPLSGEGRTFAELVRQYSGDLPFRAVLDELVNADVVETTDDGRVRLLARSYVPGEEDGVKLHILGTDVGHLIGTIDHNLQASVPERLFQRKVSYDNLPLEALPVFREMAATSAQALLEELDNWLAENDRDANPKVGGTGRYDAGLGVYYFQNRYKENDED